MLEFLTQAQNLLDEEAEPYKMGQINTGLAEAFIESGLPEIGLAKHLKALDYYRRTGNPRAVSAMGFLIGKAQYLLGNYAEAQMNLQRALADAESIKDKKVAALCNDYLGQTFEAMNDYANSLRYFRGCA